MRLATPKRKPPGENLVPLINVVFLILIFFLAASVIRPFSSADIVLAKTEQPTEAPNLRRLIFVGSDGPMLQHGQRATSEDIAAAAKQWLGEKEKPVAVIADHKVFASDVLSVIEKLRGFGIENVELLTQKAR